jgi:hypothetical protein
MPIITIILLIIVSQFITRQWLFGSAVFDFIARIWLSLCLCMSYIVLANLDKYRLWFYGRRIENLNSENGVMTTIWNISMGIMLGFFALLITRWAVQVFLPIFIHFGWPIAFLNGIILSVPIIARHQKFLF